MIGRLTFIFWVLLPLGIFGQNKIIIDLKVPLLETTNLAAAQAGATVYLMQSDWATVSDINELSDFSIDLKIEAYHLGVKVESQLELLLK